MTGEFLYLTADQIGATSGGGAVTSHESLALCEFAAENGCEFRGVGRDELGKVDKVEFWTSTKEEFDREMSDPWFWDRLAYHQFGSNVKLAHLYAGTFGHCVKKMRDNGTKVVYTCAAHDKDLSRREHEKLAIPYNYPHLTEPYLWNRYLAGYLAADVLVCPSKHSADVMRGYGAKQRIEVIPHGVHLPAKVAPLPQKFTVGYLGAVGADKGLIYLLQAWRKLNYADATLVLAGKFTNSPFMQHLVVDHAGSTECITLKDRTIFSTGLGESCYVELRGWVEDVSNFYDNISLYVQPSVTEGFGIEVLEAMAHGRPVLCSTGAGAVDLVPESDRFSRRDSSNLASRIDHCRKTYDLDFWGRRNQERVGEYTWDKIRTRYKQLWKEVLS